MSCYKCEAGWCGDHAESRFTDADVERVKEILNAIPASGASYRKDMEGLLARLEAAEHAKSSYKALLPGHITAEEKIWRKMVGR